MRNQMKTGIPWLAATLLLVAAGILFDHPAQGDEHGTSTIVSTHLAPDAGSLSRLSDLYFPPDDPPTTKPADEDDDSNGGPLAEGKPILRKLSKEEINRLRYMELRAMRLASPDTDRALGQPDRVSVKIPRESVDEFLVDMEGDPHFQGNRARRDFLKLTAPQKLHVMASYKGAKFADKVEIESDPEIYVEFRRNVLPIVLRGCATSGCHPAGPDGTAGFRLFKDPKRTAGTTYADFLMLNEVDVGDEPLINRGKPENSYLLTYMLPSKDVRPAQRHPGNIDMRPIFQSRKTPGFVRIRKWIASLKHPVEDYGVSLYPAGTKPSMRPDVIPEEPKVMPEKRSGTNPDQPPNQP